MQGFSKVFAFGICAGLYKTEAATL